MVDLKKNYGKFQVVFWWNFTDEKPYTIKH